MLFWLEDGELKPYEVGTDAQGYSFDSEDCYHRANTAGEIMSSPVRTIEASQALSEAMENMQSLGVAHLAVMENGQFAGLLSDRDVLIAENDFDFVGQHMSRQLLLASPKEPIWRIAQLMVQHRVNCIPILNDQCFLVGILTTTDILGCMTYQSTQEFWC